MPGDLTTPAISIIIPTLNEAERIDFLLDDLTGIFASKEVIVVDGGSSDSTVERARARGPRVIASHKGRGIQLRAGAEVACAPLLCFLHADARLTAGASRALSALATHPRTGAFAFRLRIDGRQRIFRLIEFGANLRSRLFALPYGDQGLIIDRNTYERVGGHPAEPLMEDVALALTLRRDRTPIRLLPEELEVSNRRWKSEGPVRRSIRNLGLLVRYLAGADPASLSREYRPQEGTS